MRSTIRLSHSAPSGNSFGTVPKLLFQTGKLACLAGDVVKKHLFRTAQASKSLKIGTGLPGVRISPRLPLES
jgi:hypothetical protein